MKYESEVIHEILEQWGHELSSLHYQSECVETWIDETKGAYPKLCDYQSEWLNYILENKIGYFPYETITTNSTATINNVVPFAYKSAILTGNTLVNLVKESSEIKIVGKASLTLAKYQVNHIDITKDYTVLFEINDFNGSGNISFSLGTQSKGVSLEEVNHNGKFNVLIPSSKIGSEMNEIWFYWTGGNWVDGNSATIKNIVLIEGDYTNVEIPYFEGMQSVKMPVLTISNEDGTKTNILTVNEEVELRGIGDVKDTLDISTGEKVERIGEIVLDGSEYWAYTGDHISNEEYAVYHAKITTPISSSNIGVADKLVYDIEAISGTVFTKECIFINSKFQVCYLRIKRERGNIANYLNSNPITVQYQLETEVIKTVDLMIINQDGETISEIKPFEGTMNIEVSGNPIAPTAILEIPVEAITQNLNSFIKEE